MKAKFPRFVFPLLMASLVAVSLWFASPHSARALNISFPSQPSNVSSGQTVTFSVTVAIESTELLPIKTADLHIKNGSGTDVVTWTGLRTDNGTGNYPNSNGAVSLSAVSSLSYGYGDRVGQGTSWTPSGGPAYFGYGYGYGMPAENIAYSFSWTPSASMTGTFSAMVTITGDTGRTFSASTSSFTVSAPPPSGGFGGGGGGGGGVPAGPGVTSLVPYTNEVGLFNLEAKVSSDDGKVTIVFAKGVQANTKDGGSMRSVSIAKMTDPPAPPADTKVIGLVYELGPSGATFKPAISLTFSYDPTLIPTGVLEKNLVLATWDAATSKWIELQGVVDTAARTITVKIEHFSAFTVLAHTKPASFSTSGFNISPAQVNAGEPVTITISLSNTGDLAGTYTASLKINGTLESTKTVELAAGSSSTVSFTVKRDASGTYPVDLNGSTGSFVVKSVAVAPPAKFETSALSISPLSVESGQKVVVSIVVVNNGGQQGTYRVDLKVNGAVTESQNLVLDPGARKTASFDVYRVDAGSYLLEVGGFSGTFEVKPLVVVASTREVSWWMIGGVVAVIVAISLIVAMSLRRRA